MDSIRADTALKAACLAGSLMATDVRAATDITTVTILNLPCYKTSSGKREVLEFLSEAGFVLTCHFGDHR